MSRRIGLALTFLLAIALTGCQDSAPKRKDGEKNAATAQWKAARAGVMITLAQDQYNGGNFDTARGTTDEALRIAPQNVALRVLSARIAIEQGNLDRAEAELRAAQAIDPAAPAPDYYYGVIMQRWQRLPRALELYTAAFEKNPKDLSYLLARAETLVALDRETEAVALLQKSLTEFENSPEIRSALGQVYMRQRRYPEAADVLRQAVMLGADDEGLREQLARALYQAGKFADALPVLERVLKSDKYAKRADLFTLLGECQLASDNPRDARASFETASTLQPQNTSYLLNLAKASLESNDVRRAEIAVRKALAISPSDSHGNLLLGYVRLEQEKLPEALAAFRRASQGDTGDSVALCMSGVVLEKLGRRDEAAQQYAKALAVKPDDDLARQLLTKLQSVAGIDPNQ